jgi:hypothetical protein
VALDPEAQLDPRPRSDIAFTAILLSSAALVLLAPALRERAVLAATWSLEIVSRLVDRPTWAVVAAYSVLMAWSVALECGRPKGRRAALLGAIPASLALLGLAWLLYLALSWQPGPLALAAATALLGSAAIDRGGKPRRPKPAALGSAWTPPLLSLLLAAHLLLEGTLGHVLTPAVQAANAGLAWISRPLPWLWDASVAGLPALLPLILVGGRRGEARGAAGAAAGSTVRAVAALAAGAGVAGAMVGWIYPESLGFLAAVATGLATAFAAADSGRRLLPWLPPDPLGCVRALAPLALLILSVCAAGYGAESFRCGSLGNARALRRLAPDAGAFALTTTEDARFLVVSRRESREILVLDARSGFEQARVSTRSRTDTLFLRTEPETLLPLSGSEVLVLLARSDDERGNRLRRFDAAAGRWLGDWAALAGGVSDLARGADGSVWVSSEFEARIVELDPRDLTVRREIRLPEGAESNALALEPGGRRAWTVGLWDDGMLRAVDLPGGQQSAETWVGTPQWGLVTVPALQRLFVARFRYGDVLGFDAASLALLERRRLGFGLRPLVGTPDGSLLAAGELYGGKLWAWDARTGAERGGLRLGGHLKALHLGRDGAIYGGSDCGVFRWEPGSGD